MVDPAGGNHRLSALVSVNLGCDSVAVVIGIYSYRRLRSADDEGMCAQPFVGIALGFVSSASQCEPVRLGPRGEQGW